MDASELTAIATAAATGDNGAAAAYTDAVTEAAADAGQPAAGFCGYHPEMGETQPVAHMEARLAHYGRHYYVYTPLTLKGRGVEFKEVFAGVPGSRKNGWNVYKVTERAMATLEKLYRVSFTMLL
jgi:hypothetical protein